MYKLKVPDDAEAGATLSVVINGQELEIPMPEGAKLGDVLELEIGGMQEEEPTEADGFGESDLIELPTSNSPSAQRYRLVVYPTARPVLSGAQGDDWRLCWRRNDTSCGIER